MKLIGILILSIKIEMVETGVAEHYNIRVKMKPHEQKMIPIEVGNLNVEVKMVDTGVADLDVFVKMKPIEQILVDGFCFCGDVQITVCDCPESWVND